MSKSKDGGPAFPCDNYRDPMCGDVWNPWTEGTGGMSLRDWFAGMAMQSWIITLSRRYGQEGYNDHDANIEACRLAIETADNMVVLLKQEGGV